MEFGGWAGREGGPGASGRQGQFLSELVTPNHKGSFPSTLKGVGRGEYLQHRASGPHMGRSKIVEAPASVAPDAHQSYGVSRRREERMSAWGWGRIALPWDLRVKTGRRGPGPLPPRRPPRTTLRSSPLRPRAALPGNEAAPPAKGRVAVGSSSRSRCRQRFFLQDRGREAHKSPSTAQSPNGRLLYIS